MIRYTTQPKKKKEVSSKEEREGQKNLNKDADTLNRTKNESNGEISLDRARRLRKKHRGNKPQSQASGLRRHMGTSGEKCANKKYPAQAIDDAGIGEKTLS